MSLSMSRRYRLMTVRVSSPRLELMDYIPWSVGQVGVLAFSRVCGLAQGAPSLVQASELRWISCKPTAVDDPVYRWELKEV